MSLPLRLAPLAVVLSFIGGPALRAVEPSPSADAAAAHPGVPPVDPTAPVRRLVAAAGYANLEALNKELAAGVDINARTPEGLTAYLVARMRGQQDICDLLVKRGADPRVPFPASDKLVDALFRRRFEAGAPGAAVLVARDGKILFEKGYGLANIETKEPVTPATTFRIGSLTKQFTASAILRLQEEGKLNVSDPLDKFYPDFPRGGELPLQRLLTHTSGIHSYTDEIDFLDRVGKPVAPATVIASIRTAPLEFNPGAKWQYSNSNYFILGEIVAKVSGLSYGDFLGAAFFGPLGMETTGVYHNASPPPGAAVGYSFKGGRFERALDWDMSWAGGAGALYSTVGDLCRWNEGIFGGRVLNARSLEEALQPVVTVENRNEQRGAGYGFGWGISQFRGQREISHGGGLQGFLSFLLRLPDQKFTVVVLVNASPPKPGTDPAGLAHQVTELYLGNSLPPLPPRPAEGAVSDDALEAIVGRYDYGMVVMVITKEGHRVFTRLGTQQRFEIFPRSESDFFLKVVDAQLTFVKDPKGRVTGVIHHQGGVTLHAARLPDLAEVTLADARSTPILGQYQLAPGRILAVTREAGRLYTQLTGQPRLEIGALSETEFFVRAVNARLTFVKDGTGKVVRVTLLQKGRTHDLPKVK
jgi:CubicO group peptidase (beta-lactamase class C family)